MPPKTTSKKPVEFVPALTRLKAHLVPLTEEGASVNVPLSQIVHLATQSTRPIIKSDVYVKLGVFEDKGGWHGSYNIMARELTAVERKELFDDITAMQADPEEAPSMEQSSNYRHSFLANKVDGFTDTHTHHYTHTRTRHYTHTHTHTHTHTLSLSPGTRHSNVEGLECGGGYLRHHRRRTSSTSHADPCAGLRG